MVTKGESWGLGRAQGQFGVCEQTERSLNGY
jgi:hypothetical protein